MATLEIYRDPRDNGNILVERSGIKYPFYYDTTNQTEAKTFGKLVEALILCPNEIKQFIPSLL